MAVAVASVNDRVKVTCDIVTCDIISFFSDTQNCFSIQTVSQLFETIEKCQAGF